MGWLLRDGQVLASLEVVEGLAARSRGLSGRASCEGGLLLKGARAAHAFGVRFPLDVAWIDKDSVVVAIARLRPYSFALPRWQAGSVLEAEAGAFARWRLAVGDTLELKE